MDTGAIVVDELQVISDLHLGGEAPFQMFGETAALAGWIRSLLPPAAPACRRALVINGDFVDFLAEQPSRHFDAEGAVGKLERIAADPAFLPVFDALRAFLSVPQHRLGIVLGNHDLELALPWVRATLKQLLCEGDDARAGRIDWALDGAGLLLRLGGEAGPRVLCVHGNEVDGWNVVEHETLRRMGREGLRDQRLDTEYIPNAGSRMVIEVMNDIKRRYPFVDLLKPETKAVMPTLLALDPKAAAALADLPSLVARQEIDSARIAMNLLGGDPDADAADAADPLAAARAAARLRAVPAPVRAAARREATLQLLDRVEADHREGRASLDLLARAERAETLGNFGAVVALVTGGGRVEALRQKLSDLASDRSFSTLDRDDTFSKMHARVSTNIDFLVTGHTHLARAIEREFGRAYYFNTGTWARVFRIRDETLASADAFRGLFDALGANRIDALDAAPGLEPVRPHLAAFWCDAAGVNGELRTVPPIPPFAAAPVAGTRYTRR
jgi:hypothetical protein